MAAWRQAGRIASRAVVAAFFVLGLVLLAGIVFFSVSSSYHAYVVTGKSMEPAIKKGDVVLVGPISGFLSRPLTPGAVVSFQSPNGLVTHRVASVDGRYLTTRGDAVGRDDPWVISAGEVSGVMLTRIPKLGAVPELLWTAHGLPVILLAFVCVAFSVIIASPDRSQTRRARRAAVAPAGRRLHARSPLHHRGL